MDEINSSEVLMGFVDWLTTRDEIVTFSKSHDAANAVDLVGMFMKNNNLPRIRDGYSNNLKFPNEEEQ